MLIARSASFSSMTQEMLISLAPVQKGKHSIVLPAHPSQERESDHSQRT
jgi:hypothetical protein